VSSFEAAENQLKIPMIMLLLKTDTEEARNLRAKADGICKKT
jgi:N-acetylmuramic acid 6-phosphate (MurNAc-6-P) etherase